MFKTNDLANWSLRATNFFLGYDEFEQAGNARVVDLNPHLPYIYVPDQDWQIISERLQDIYHDIRCEFDENVCKFQKRCSMIPHVDIPLQFEINDGTSKELFEITQR